MKVHIMPIGFTPGVFTASTRPLVRYGADYIIGLHSEFGGKNEKQKVDATINEVERVSGLKVQRESVKGKTVSDFISAFVPLLDKFKKDDIYIHLAGGERFLSLSLILASFLSKSKPQFVVALDMKDGTPNSFEILPSPKIVTPSNAQLEILKAIENSPQKLSEISKKVKYRTPEAAMTATYRHLQKLVEMGFVKYGNDRRYEKTTFGTLFLIYG